MQQSTLSARSFQLPPSNTSSYHPGILSIMASTKTHPATQRAKVTTLAGRTRATLNQAGRNVIDRIRSCLARANHVNANEYEAQTALKMAHKIMAEHNIQQWQVMQMEDKDQLRKRAGISEVDIAFANGRRRVVFQTWVVDLVTAMAKFFECQVSSTGYDPPLCNHLDILWNKRTHRIGRPRLRDDPQSNPRLGLCPYSCFRAEQLFNWCRARIASSCGGTISRYGASREGL